MKCFKCGMNVPDDSEFCPYCGSKIEEQQYIEETAPEVPTCGNCKKQVPEDSGFCPYCGSRISKAGQEVLSRLENTCGMNECQENTEKNKGKEKVSQIEPEQEDTINREKAEKGAVGAKKIAKIAAPIVCVATAIVILFNFVIIPKTKNRKYEEFVSAEVGDYITFGTYEQDNDLSNGAEEIEWLVLDKEDEKLFVISKYGLDSMPYSVEVNQYTWDTSSIREWLNGAFFNVAFSEDEQKLIPTVTVSPDDSPWDQSVNQGYATKDKIFLLSCAEHEKYLVDESAQRCQATMYAKQNGAFVQKDYGYSFWWLRTLHANRFADGWAICIDQNGAFKATDVDYEKNVVRPAMWIDFSLVDTKGFPGTQISDTNENKDELEESLIEENNNTVDTKDIKNVKVGDYITFGTYEQDNDLSNGAEKIEWLVIDKEDEKLFVISKYGLDTMSYSVKGDQCTWDTSPIRKWLNNMFFNVAFSEDEQKFIPTVTVSPDDSPFSPDINQGSATEDKIFLLSCAEHEKYLVDESAQRCQATMYAKQNGAYVQKDYGYSFWWLRTICQPFRSDGQVHSVDHYGGSKITDIGYEKNVVRPAMWIDLSLMGTEHRLELLQMR